MANAKRGSPRAPDRKRQGRRPGPRASNEKASGRAGGNRGRGTPSADVTEFPRYAPECYACPIGALSMAIQKTRPDTAQHLLRSAQELVLAVRGLLDGLSDFFAVMEERSQTTQVQSIPIRRR